MKFQAFWHGKLSPYEKICIKSFIDNGHEVDVYCYQRVKVTGACRRNAAEVVPWQNIFYGKRKNAGCFSNLFRFELLHQRGGWWIDLDVICLSRNIPEFTRFFARQDDEFINTAVLYSEVGDPLMDACRKRAHEIGASADLEGIQTGPYLLTDIVKRMGLEGEARPAQTCYPIAFSDAARLLNPQFRPDISKAFMMHLWGQTLNWHRVDKWRLPPKGSLMREFADKYQVEGWHKERA